MEEFRPIDGQTLPEALGQYARQDAARFHMPGHKGAGMAGFMHDALMRWDVSELPFSDNLHMPTGAILRMEQALATAYGAKCAFLSVGGSSAAIIAMLLSLGSGARLLLARDCHKSALAGAVLADADVSFVLPAYDEAQGLYGMVTPDALERALTEQPADAVLVTSPNYYGFTADLPALRDTAHRHGALLLVDAAHGAHFPFSDALPAGAGGVADLWCVSQHKTMNALTQAASLFLGDCRIDADAVQRMLSLVLSTSPSYLLMASLDWSLYCAKRQDWTKQAARAAAFEKRLAAIGGVRIFGDPPAAGAVSRDPARVVFDVTKRGYTGFAVKNALEAQGVYPEMADESRVVLITTPEDPERWYARTAAALAALPAKEPLDLRQQRMDALPARAVRLREAALAKTERVPFSEAAGRIAAEAAGFYPPGVALVVPGERIDGATLAQFSRGVSAGAALFGCTDERLAVIR